MQRLGRKEEEWFHQEVIIGKAPGRIPSLVVALGNSNPQKTEVDCAVIHMSLTALPSYSIMVMLIRIMIESKVDPGT